MSLWADCRSKQAVFVQRGLRVAVIPLIQQTDFFASLDTRNATDGFGRRVNTLKFGQN